MADLRRVMGWGIASALAAGVVAAQSDLEAWIETERSNGTLVITPYCRSVTGLAVTYRLVSAKTGKSGTSRSTQSGRVALRPGVAELLSTLHLGLSGDDRYLLEAGAGGNQEQDQQLVLGRLQRR